MGPLCGRRREPLPAPARAGSLWERVPPFPPSCSTRGPEPACGCGHTCACGHGARVCPCACTVHPCASACMRECVLTCVHVTHVYTHMCTCVFTSSYVFVCEHLSLCVYVCVCTYLCMHECVRVCVCVHLTVRACICVCACVCTCLCVHECVPVPVGAHMHSPGDSPDHRRVGVGGAGGTAFPDLRGPLLRRRAKQRGVPPGGPASGGSSRPGEPAWRSRSHPRPAAAVSPTTPGSPRDARWALRGAPGCAMAAPFLLRKPPRPGTGPGEEQVGPSGPSHPPFGDR